MSRVLGHIPTRILPSQQDLSFSYYFPHAQSMGGTDASPRTPQNWKYRRELGLHSTCTAAPRGNSAGVPEVAVVVMRHGGLSVQSDPKVKAGAS